MNAYKFKFKIFNKISEENMFLKDKLEKEGERWKLVKNGKSLFLP